MNHFVYECFNITNEQKIWRDENPNKARIYI